MQKMYTDNYKMLFKNGNQMKMKRHCVCIDLKTEHCLQDSILKIDLQIQCNPY